MTKPRSKTPIESFGAELFNALIEGSKRKIEVHTTYRDAVKIRLRVHQLRHRMREDAHPLYPVAARTRVTITWNDDIEVLTNQKKMRFPKDINTLVIMTFAPHDSEFGDIFKKAGLEIKPIDFTSDEVGGASDAAPTLDDLLKDFK